MIAFPTDAEIAAAVAQCDLEDLAEDLGGFVTEDGFVNFHDPADLDAFCDLLVEAGVAILDQRLR